MRRFLALATAFGAGGCSLLLGVDWDRVAVEGERASEQREDDGGGVLGPDASSGSLPDGGAGDASGPDGVDGSTGPTLLASAGVVATATGLAQQSHLVWAGGAARWVLFYPKDGAPTMRTRLSADFVSWTDGPELALPNDHGGDGRNFTVSAATFGTVDVFHFGLSLLATPPLRRHYHLRATLEGGVLTSGDATALSSSTRERADIHPDGPAVAVAEDGDVYDFTGWAGTSDDGTGLTGNPTVWRASAPEAGGAWTPTWSRTDISTVAEISNARAAIALGGPSILAFWESGDLEPEPTNVRFSRTSGTTWSTVGSVFASAAQHASDWTVLRVAADDVHAVRRRSTGTLDHRRYDGSTWRDGSAIAPEPLVKGAGLVLVQGASGPTLVGLKADGTIRATSWQAAGWGAWIVLAPPAAGRAWLTGVSSAGHAAIAWTETAGTSRVIAGLRLR